MANNYPQLALVTDAIAASMENTLVASKLMRWMDRGSSKIGPLNRFQVIERVSPRYNSRRTTGNVADLSAGKQDTVAGAEIFQLNSLIGYDFFDEDFSRVRDLDMAMKDERLKAIGRNAGEDVDADVLSFTARAGNNQTGVSGNAVNSIEALQAGYVRLKEKALQTALCLRFFPIATTQPCRSISLRLRLPTVARRKPFSVRFRAP